MFKVITLAETEHPILNAEFGHGSVGIAIGEAGGVPSLSLYPIEAGEVGRDMPRNPVDPNEVLICLTFANERGLDTLIQGLEKLRKEQFHETGRLGSVQLP
jgi:hypothetical protein